MKKKAYQKWLIIVSNISLVAGLVLPFVSTAEARKLSDRVIAAATEGAENNLLKNGSFEDYSGDKGIADKWDVESDTDVTGDFQVVESPVDSGKYAQKVKATGIAKDKGMKIVQKVKVDSDKKYRLSGDVNIASLSQSTLQVGIEFFDAEGNSLDSKSVDLTDEKLDEYVSVKEVVTTPPDVSYAQIYAQLKSTEDGGEGSLFLDDFRLENHEEEPVAELPSTPANLKADPKATRIVLEWNEVKNAASYELKRDDAVVFTGNETRFADKDLQPETEYVYTLLAKNEQGASEPATIRVKTLKQEDQLPTAISADPVAVSVLTGATQQLRIQAHYPDSTVVEVTDKATYQISDETIATISELGIITGLKEGTAKIAISYQEQKLEIDLLVYNTAVPLTGISLEKSNLLMSPGVEEQVKVAFQPENATNKQVKWTSSDEAIVIVDSTGKITAKAVGNATVTVTSEDGGFTSTVNVVVQEASEWAEVLKRVGEEYNWYDLNPYRILDNLSELQEELPDEEVTFTDHEGKVVTDSSSKRLARYIKSYEKAISENMISDNRYSGTEVSHSQLNLFNLLAAYKNAYDQDLSNEEQDMLLDNITNLLMLELQQLEAIKEDAAQYADNLSKAGESVDPGYLKDLEEFQASWEALLEEFKNGTIVQPFKKIQNLMDTGSNLLAFYGLNYKIENLKTDTDNDGIPDLIELTFKTDIYSADTDQDGLSDKEEIKYNLDPTQADSDGDGIPDSEADQDQDGLSNTEEARLGTNFENADTDNDLIPDGDEVNKYHTSPTHWDTDRDGISDKREIDLGLNPLREDSDGDGQPDSKIRMTEKIEINEDEQRSFEAAGVIPKVTMDGFPQSSENTMVSDAFENPFVRNTPHMIGHPVNLDVSEDFEQVTLDFTLNEKWNHLDLQKLAVMYYDKEKQLLRKLPNTQINEADRTITATGDKYGYYVLVDGEEWNKLLETPYDPGKPAVIRGKIENFVLATTYAVGNQSIFNYGTIERNKVEEAIRSTNIPADLVQGQVFSNQLVSPSYISSAIDQLAANAALKNKWKVLLVASKEQHLADPNLANAIAKANENQIMIYTYWTSNEMGSGEWTLQQLAEQTGGQYAESDLQDVTQSVPILTSIWNGVMAQEDIDQDGIPDRVEKEGIRLGTMERVVLSTSLEDSDGDGVIDGKDSDGNGLLDGYEMGYTDVEGNPLKETAVTEHEVPKDEVVAFTLSKGSKPKTTNEVNESNKHFYYDPKTCCDNDPIKNAGMYVQIEDSWVFITLKPKYNVDWSWYELNLDQLPWRSLVIKKRIDLLNEADIPGPIKYNSHYVDLKRELQWWLIHIDPDVVAANGRGAGFFKKLIKNGANETELIQGECIAALFIKEFGPNNPAKPSQRKITRDGIIKKVEFKNAKGKASVVIKEVVPKNFETVEDYLVSTGGVVEGYSSAVEFRRTVDIVNIYLNKPWGSPRIINKDLAGLPMNGPGIARFDVIGFPIFKDYVRFTAQIDKKLYLAKDDVQFIEASKQLKAAIESGSSKVKGTFTAEEKKLIDQAAAGKNQGRIANYTWHHHQVEGKIELIPLFVHRSVTHTGGNAIWGGSKR
ncbi:MULTISPECIES: Ig-like domain-containing protein [Brevibacillus]|uniref:Ig-like domain-containing protein n=1 Tax=Brevibacillus TaxID=55080 RepID=UPI000D0F0DA3|nr:MULTISPECIES: Ig-like domain-containing protein [Brevibacillus]MED1945307.1 Ig-like domain-containing protein [Brevibacillus formosus]MED1998570.1 Ig-like domain-containing protein [Brevibacillus formosus]MED2083539.1 Ig-like domain-containing protein [Brevibacillus formosus]PSK20932.1 hypothetical protein C7R94_02335 [Brevibacillus sp. NRRL NRS-603]